MAGGAARAEGARRKNTRLPQPPAACAFPRATRSAGGDRGLSRRAARRGGASRLPVRRDENRPAPVRRKNHRDRWPASPRVAASAAKTQGALAGTPRRARRDQTPGAAPAFPHRQRRRARVGEGAGREWNRRFCAFLSAQVDAITNGTAASDQFPPPDATIFPPPDATIFPPPDATIADPLCEMKFPPPVATSP